MRHAIELLEQGKKQLSKGDWQAASETLMKAYDHLKDKIDNDEDMKVLAEIMRRKGLADARIGELEEAVSEVKMSLDISKNLKDPVGEADALRQLGYIHWQKGDNTMALELYNNALEKAEGCMAKELVGRTKIEIANVHNHQGNYGSAKRVYLDAISVLKEVNSPNELARAYNNLGDCYMNNNELDEALETLRQCMDIASKIGDLTIKGWAAFNCAECFTRLKETKLAKEYLDMALEYLTQVDDRVGVASSLRNLGVVYIVEKDWTMAKETLEKAQSMARQIGMVGLEGIILRSMGDMWLARGERPKAVTSYEKAETALRDGGRAKEADEVTKVLSGLKN